MRNRKQSAKLKEEILTLWDTGTYSKYRIAQLVKVTPSYVIQLIKKERN
jgi:predicted transcriptional regulator